MSNPSELGVWNTLNQDRALKYIDNKLFHYWPCSLAKQGDNALGTVRPSVRQCSHGWTDVLIPKSNSGHKQTQNKYQCDQTHPNAQSSVRFCASTKSTCFKILVKCIMCIDKCNGQKIPVMIKHYLHMFRRTSDAILTKDLSITTYQWPWLKATVFP